MTTERWRRVQAAFLEIADLPQGQKLEALGRLDSEIREEVAAMVAADDPDIDAPIDEDWEGSVHEALSGLSEAEAPERVGPWHIVRELGRGGMGIVYLAERADEQFEQTVALKLIKRGMDSDAILARFLNERQVLATLQHPHIARLYDGGITEEGQPWFAMEYVDGSPITDHCNKNDLSLRERLELFLKVCHAVRHAHNQLIIHRDLKPSNILVTKDGEPHLLDFGLAKVLQDPTGDPATTRRGQRWMTLDYASPEQVKGDPVGTPSDTYQLGLVLYEMLTGQRAYTVKGLSPTEAERIICEVDPRKPSTAVFSNDSVASTGRSTLPAHPEKRRKRLRGDLDTIVLKALHKDPARRYASAETLAGDLERYLNDLPIYARADTLGYRTKKFVQRHRWPVVAGVLVFFSLLAGLGGTLWQAHQAKMEARRAEEVRTFLVELFQANDPGVAQGDTITVREVLERGIEHANSLEDQPILQATLLGVMADVYHNLGEWSQAEKLYRRALTAWNTLPRNPAQEEEYTRSLFGLALSRGKQYHFEESEALFRQVIRRRRDEGTADEILQEALFHRYVTLHALNRTEEAENAFLAWKALLENSRTTLDAEGADRLVEFAQTLTIRGELRGDLESLERGKELFSQALDILRATHGPRHPSVANALNYQGNLLVLELQLIPIRRPNALPSSDLIAKADSVTREALELHRAIYSESNPETWLSLRTRSSLLMITGRFDDAQELASEALSLTEKFHGTDNNFWISTLRRLGHISLSRGDFEEAETLFRNVRDWRADSYGKDYLYTLNDQLDLGRALVGAEKFEEAENETTHVYETLEAQRGRNDWKTQRALQALVELYEAWDKPEQAAEFRELLITERAEAE